MEKFAFPEHSSPVASSLFDEACNFGKSALKLVSKNPTVTFGALAAMAVVVPELKVVRAAGEAENAALGVASVARLEEGIAAEGRLLLQPKLIDSLSGLVPEGSGLKLANFRCANMIEQNGAKILENESGLFGADTATRMSIHPDKIVLESAQEFKPHTLQSARVADELVNGGKLTRETIALNEAGQPVAWTYENPAGVYGKGTCTHILRDAFGDRVETSTDGLFNFVLTDNGAVTVCRDGVCEKATLMSPTRNGNPLRIIENRNGIFGPGTATTLQDAVNIRTAAAEFADGKPFYPKAIRCTALPEGAQVLKAQVARGKTIFDGIAAQNEAAPIRLTLSPSQSGRGMHNVAAEFAGGTKTTYELPAESLLLHSY